MRDVVWQGRPVSVTHGNPVGTRIGGNPHARDRAVTVCAERVKEVLGVVDNLFALRHQVRHRLFDHPQILGPVHLDDLLNVQVHVLPTSVMTGA